MEKSIVPAIIAAGELTREHVPLIEKDITAVLLQSFNDCAQTLFKNYVHHVQRLQSMQDAIRDDEAGLIDNGVLIGRADIKETLRQTEQKLQEIEKLGGVRKTYANLFRYEVAYHVRREQTKATDMTLIPCWRSYKKITEFTENLLLNATAFLPIGNKAPSLEEQETQNEFVSKMGEVGYTPAQLRQAVTLYQKHRM